MLREPSSILFSFTAKIWLRSKLRGFDKLGFRIIELSLQDSFNPTKLFSDWEYTVEIFDKRLIL